MNTKQAFIALVTIFFINALGLYYGWYRNFFWFDMTLHFLGGFFMAMLLSIYLKDYFIGSSKIKNTLIVLGVVSFMGIAWEFTEYLANTILSPLIYDQLAIKTYFMGDLDDTINDLLMDILGAGLFSLILHPFRSSETH